ncbi:hypothetical protein DPMN_139028 [Dreissena polymorpha]|uniref:Uncharacterized protein n=1 Tax=Dreissena polymorpha TaxID=45954 RepID=A0A9D4JHT1_DREPO|nr:hypothetical protein DPMN_139028 [Dreissena polymorpha]
MVGFIEEIVAICYKTKEKLFDIFDIQSLHTSDNANMKSMDNSGIHAVASRPKRQAKSGSKPQRRNGT